MAEKKASSKKVAAKPTKYNRGSYNKKSATQISTSDAWMMARRVAEFAYIFQSLAKNPDEKENKNITRALSKIKPVLQEAYKGWQDEASRVWKLQSAEELEEVFVGIHDNSIFEEKTEEEVERRVWQLINYGDISAEDLFDNNPIKISAIRKFITEMNKGPRDAARHFLDKKGGHGSESQVRKYRKDFKSGELPNPMVQIGTPYVERGQFIIEVLARLLDLSTDELKWINEGIVNILRDRRDS